MSKILPVDQSLIPVSFKRRLAYSGSFLEEYVEKIKVLLYFGWLQKCNHLYKVTSKLHLLRVTIIKDKLGLSWATPELSVVLILVELVSKSQYYVCTMVPVYVPIVFLQF